MEKTYQVYIKASTMVEVTLDPTEYPTASALWHAIEQAAKEDSGVYSFGSVDDVDIDDYSEDDVKGGEEDESNVD